MAEKEEKVIPIVCVPHLSEETGEEIPNRTSIHFYNGSVVGILATLNKIRDEFFAVKDPEKHGLLSDEVGLIVVLEGQAYVWHGEGWYSSGEKDIMDWQVSVPGDRRDTVHQFARDYGWLKVTE